MSHVDLSAPHIAVSKEPARCESRNLRVTARPRRTAAGEAPTLDRCLELGCDLYIFGIDSATDVVFKDRDSRERPFNKTRRMGLPATKPHRRPIARVVGTRVHALLPVQLISAYRFEEQVAGLRRSSTIKNGKGDDIAIDGETKEDFIRLFTEGYAVAGELLEAVYKTGRFLYQVREIFKPKCRMEGTMPSLMEGLQEDLGRCDHLREARSIVFDGRSAKKRKSDEPSPSMQGDSPATTMIAVSDIETHPAFEHLLCVDEGLRARLSSTMQNKGFFQSEPVVLGLWPGLESPVLIDGHVRWLAARDANIAKIPCVIMEFPDEMAALQIATDLQTARRQNTDGSLYRLCESFDELMERGRSSQDEQTSKLLPYGSNFSGRSASARRTATLIGCNYRKIDKIRRIRKEGTPGIQEAVRNDQMGIEKAHRIIREMQLGEDENKRNAAHARATKKVLTEENFDKLNELGGDLHEHANAALELYLRTLEDTERAPDPNE